MNILVVQSNQHVVDYWLLTVYYRMSVQVQGVGRPLCVMGVSMKPQTYFSQCSVYEAYFVGQLLRSQVKG